MISFQGFDRSAFFRRGAVRVEAAVLAALGVDPDKYDLDDPYVGPFSTYSYQDLDLAFYGSPPDIPEVNKEPFHSRKMKLYNHVLSIVGRPNGVALADPKVDLLRGQTCVLAPDFLTWYETRYLGGDTYEPHSDTIAEADEVKDTLNQPEMEMASIERLMHEYAGNDRALDFIKFYQERSVQLLSAILDANFKDPEGSPNVGSVENFISGRFDIPVTSSRANSRIREILLFFSVNERLRLTASRKRKAKG